MHKQLEMSAYTGYAPKDTAYHFFALQVGLVALISPEDVEAFWIINIDTTMGKVLASK